MRQNPDENKKVLLVLLPYWTPQIPPLGISCLKSFIRPHGIRVKTIDANVENQTRTIYDKYFDTLREYVSEGKRGNFYNIGHEILQNHMMAHLNNKEEKEYIELIKILVYKTFYSELRQQQVRRLNAIVTEFYDWMETFFLDLLEKEKPTVLGLSVYKGTLPASLFAFKRTREKHPLIQTVMGGAVFAQTLAIGTPDFDYFLEKTKEYIDKIIIGEGEQLFLKLLKGELPPNQRVYTRDDIQGTHLDLSLVEIPDYRDMNHGVYPNLAAYTSRSCPHQCSFCTETVYWGKYRKKSAKQVVDEMWKLYQHYHTQLFLLADSLLDPIIDQLAREFIHRDKSLYWDGYLRIHKKATQIDTVLGWRQGGFYRARLGVESGSQTILAAMGKKIAIQQIKTALTTLAEAGIKTSTYWIIGYPGETEHDFQQTLELIADLKDDIYEAECNPFGFYITGQVNSVEWKKNRKIVSLYPDTAKEMLMIRTWIMEGEPTREETYRRVTRFAEHCAKLGIANPYSLVDIYKADERWKKLHQNAVPSLLEFKNRTLYIEENKQVKKIMRAQTKQAKEIVFDF